MSIEPLSQSAQKLKQNGQFQQPLFNPEDQTVILKRSFANDFRYRTQRVGQAVDQKKAPSSFARNTIDFSDQKSARKNPSIKNHSIEGWSRFPELQLRKSKRSTKKGTYLQTWLNEALESAPEGHDSEGRKEYYEGLRAMRKYGIDKQTLKSKNVSVAVIESIYKKLYVYSKGLSMVFQEIADMASPDSAEKDMGIMEIFWVAHNKIMESESPYQNNFQIIERQRMRTIEQLKLDIRTLRKQFQSQVEGKERENQRLRKEIEHILSSTSQLREDFKISDCSLKLTEVTLSEEILQRLKFEEKINSVYVSYAELKEKFSDLVEEHQLTKEQLRRESVSYADLKERLRDEVVKAEELKNLWEAEQSKVADRESQIAILRQELEDKDVSLSVFKEKFQTESDEIERRGVKIQSLESRIQELELQQSRNKELLEQARRQHAGSLERIQEMSRLNDQLFQQKSTAFDQSLEAEKNNLDTTQRANMVSRTNEKLSQEKAQLLEELQEKVSESQQQQKFSQELQKSLSSKEELIENLNAKITEFRSVKDRLEVLNTLLEKEKREVYSENSSLVAKLSLQEEQIAVIVTELSGAKEKLRSQQSSAEKSQISLDRKINDLKNSLVQKDKQIQALCKQSSKFQAAVQQKAQQNIEKSQKLLSVQGELKDLKSKYILLERKLPAFAKSVEQQQKQIESSKKMQIQSEMKKEEALIKCAEFDHQMRLKEKDAELRQMGLLESVQYFEDLYHSRKSYVHPMSFQDALSRCSNLEIRGDSYREEIRNLSKVKEQLQETTAVQHRRNCQQSEELQKFTVKHEALKKSCLELTESERKLTEQLSKSKESVSSLKKQIYNISDQCQLQASEIEALREENNSLVGKLNFSIDASDKLEASLSQATTLKQALLLTLSEKEEELIRAYEDLAHLKAKGSRNNSKQVATQHNNAKAVSSQGVQTERVDPEGNFDSGQRRLVDAVQEPQSDFRPINNEKADRDQERRVNPKDFKKALRLTYMRK